MRGGRLAAGLAGALHLLCSGCEGARAPACPGQRVGTLKFTSDGGVAGGCPFAPSSGVSFTATVSFDGDSTAYLCVDRPEAEPLQGTRDGGRIELASPRAAAATVTGCGCDLAVTETLVGDLDLLPDGGAASFAGELRDAVSAAADGAACDPQGGCGVPCEMSWAVDGSP